MAKAEGSFETIVGAFFDEALIQKGDPDFNEEQRLAARGRFVAAVAEDPETVTEIENTFGVTIL